MIDNCSVCVNTKESIVSIGTHHCERVRHINRHDENNVNGPPPTGMIGDTRFIEQGMGDRKEVEQGLLHIFIKKLEEIFIKIKLRFNWRNYWRWEWLCSGKYRNVVIIWKCSWVSIIRVIGNPARFRVLYLLFEYINWRAVAQKKLNAYGDSDCVKCIPEKDT